MSPIKKAVVAGSIGLDIIPVFGEGGSEDAASLFAQGKYNDMRGTRLYLGGCVGNTGIAMHKLGAPVTLVSKVGDDLIGAVIEMMLKRQNVPIRIETMKGIPSSSTVVIAPGGADRVLLHSRGASQTFVAADLDEPLLYSADLLHFAYPTAMKTLYANEGSEFIELVRRAKATGITVSVDTSQPDPHSEPGRVNWKSVLTRALPYIDIFMPSLEELLFMLHRDEYDRVMAECRGRNPIDFVEFEQIVCLADELLAMGASVVVLKLGKKGLYLRTARREKLLRMGRAAPESAQDWADRELLFAPYFTRQIRSTTGAGDNAIAGFLTAFLRGDGPEHALAVASANALRCIESYETTDRTLPVDELDRIIAAGPAQEEIEGLPGGLWHSLEGSAALAGRCDRDKEGRTP